MTVTAPGLSEVRSYRFITPNTLDAPKLLRDHVAGLLAHTGHADLEETARLLVSEVVTNAHEHTGSPRLALTTTIRPSRVHIDLYDTHPCALPRPPARPAVLISEHGRGLLILELLASRWGCQIHGGARPFGKSVWFELPTGRETGC